MYFVHKMGIFHYHVSLPEGKWDTFWRDKSKQCKPMFFPFWGMVIPSKCIVWVRVGNILWRDIRRTPFKGGMTIPNIGSLDPGTLYLWMRWEAAEAANIGCHCPWPVASWQESRACQKLTQQWTDMKSLPWHSYHEFSLNSGTTQDLWKSLIVGGIVHCLGRQRFLVDTHRQKWTNKSYESHMAV